LTKEPQGVLRHVLAAFAGNALAFYDFVTFSYFSIDIGRTFFPSENHTLSLLASLGTFGIGFAARPVGAVVIGGMIGDRAGRRPAMVLSFSLMGIAILGFALTPSYARIGVAAPVIVVLCRLLQGFALGGEVGPTTAFVAELVPAARRGFFLAMQFAMQDVATLAAGIVGLVLAVQLSDAQLASWGWRVAMLIGASIVPFGLWLRRSLPETLHAVTGEATDDVADEGGLYERIRPYRRILVLGLVMLAAGTIGSYSIGYMTTYARDTLHLATTVAFGFTIVNGAFSIVTEFLSGWLADKYGRKPVMIVPTILLIVSIFPCYWVIGHFRSTFALYGAETVMVIFAGIAQIPVLIALTEQIPKALRSGAVAIVYALAISIFGGTTQVVLKTLIAFTGNPLSPAYYWTAASLLALIAMFLVRESAPVKQM